MVRLRALEKTDLDFLYQLENDQSLWEVSETQAPFSHETLRSYLENAHLDIRHDNCVLSLRTRTKQ